MNMKQKPATRRLKVFKALSRKGADEVLGYLLQNGKATFEELKKFMKPSNLRCVLRLLFNAKLVKTMRNPDDKRFCIYILTDEKLTYHLLEII